MRYGLSDVIGRATKPIAPRRRCFGRPSTGARHAFGCLFERSFFRDGPIGLQEKCPDSLGRTLTSRLEVGAFGSFEAAAREGFLPRCAKCRRKKGSQGGVSTARRSLALPLAIAGAKKAGAAAGNGGHCRA
jgi:hypothetical protein